MGSTDLSGALRSIFGMGGGTGYGYTITLPNGVVIKTQEGVIAGVGSEMLPTNPAGTTLRVASGIAIVNGKVYRSDDNIDFALVAPGAGINYYLIGLRAVWSTKTVRAVALGPWTAPGSVVQPLVDYSNWLYPIAVVEVDAASAVTIYDCRKFMRFTRYHLPLLRARQGGSPSNWAANGENNYILEDNAMIVVGCVGDTYDSPTHIIDILCSLGVGSANDDIFTSKPIYKVTNYGTNPRAVYYSNDSSVYGIVGQISSVDGSNLKSKDFFFAVGEELDYAAAWVPVQYTERAI
jgi:hypothetical protein